MVRGREDDGSKSESVLGLAGIGGSQKLPISRRALLYGVTGTSIGAAVVLGIVAERSEDARHRRAMNPPVNPGPATTHTPGTLAGPSAKPAWSARVERGTHAVTLAADTVVLVDGFGTVLGFDPRTGASKWQPSVEFFINDASPLLAAGDTVYGSDANGTFMAVDAAKGTLSWQTQFASQGAEISTVAGTAGPYVFSTGDVGSSGGAGKSVGMLWCVNTATQAMAWNISNVNYSLAVVASESAGVVATADEIAYRLTAYSLKDQKVVWSKDATNAGSYTAPALPADCLVVSGDTFYWAADQLYALNAATGEVRWSGSALNPGDEFQNVVVVPGKGGSGSDLVIATSTGSGGGALHAFAAQGGATKWVERGGLKFGKQTVLTSAGGVVVAAERDNGSVFAVDAETGQTRWTYHDATIDADLTWSVAADDSRVYVAYGPNLLAFEL